MKKQVFIAAAAVGIGALFLLGRRASAARAGSETVDADTDQIVDSIPGSRPAPLAGTARPSARPKPLTQNDPGFVSEASRALAAGVLAVSSAAGRWFGQPARAGTTGAP